MKQIIFGWALDSLKANASGVTQALAKNYGVKNFITYNTFNKGYTADGFANKLQSVVFCDGGPCNVMITLDSAPWSEIGEHDISKLPANHRAACAYINRFPPVDQILFENTVKELIDKINAKPGNMMQYISWQLWQEPDSAKYNHGSFAQFDYWTEIKSIILEQTNRPIYIGDFTSRKLNPDYRNYVETNPIFDLPNVHYSTSLYPEVKGSLTDYNANYPTRNLPGSAIVAYSIGTSTSKVEVDSERWMVRAVQMLQWAYDKQIDYIYFWKLFEGPEKANNIYASWIQYVGGGKLWNMQLQLIDVCKGGYEPTQDGIVGANGKRIVITGSGYSAL